MNHRNIAACITGLVLMWTTALSSQVPVPRPSPSGQGGSRPAPQPPSSGGPKVKSPGQKPATIPTQPRSKRDISERKAGSQGTGSGGTPTSRPPATPAPGLPGPGPGAPGVPEKRAPTESELKSAEQRLEVWNRSLRPAKREHWVGQVVFLDKAHLGKSLRIEMWLERSETGGMQVRFKHARFGDLPDAQLLSRATDDGNRSWWRLRPEEGPEVKADDGRSGPVRDLLSDLIPIEANGPHELEYIDTDLMDSRRVLLFGYNDGNPSIVTFRPDLNLVSRVEILDEKHEKALREIRFSTAERRGVHRRFLHLMRHDFETGDSLRVEWEMPKINLDLPDDFFETTALLKASAGAKKETKDSDAK